MKNKNVIFDFGANEGQNLEYYLMKANKVVCIEANPDLTKKIREKFKKEIQKKRLVILNTLVISDTREKMINFYIHNKDNVLSSVIAPKDKSKFTLKRLKGMPVNKILEKYISKGDTFYYAKFDLEGYDGKIIKSMFNAGYFPKYISTEIHNLDSFEVVASSGMYNAFKISNGNSVGKLKNIKVTTMFGPRKISFKRHSAGPMGEDLPGKWMSEESVVRILEIEGLGWKDVHACQEIDENQVMKLSSRYFIFLTTTKKFTNIYRSIIPFKLRNSKLFRKIRFEVFNK